MNNIFFSRIVFLILFVCISQLAIAKEYYFKHYRNEQGLSHNTVLCTAQDKSGFMWFGTTYGLNRFDGNRFKHYTNIEGDSSSVTSNYIHAIYPDKEGNVWIATSHELCVYKHSEDQFVRFSQLNNQHLVINAVFNVVEDQSRNLWITSGNRVYKYNLDSHNAEEYNDFKYSIRMICANPSGSVWAIGYDGEVAQYQAQTNTFEHFCDAGDITDGPAYINCVITDDEYGVWLGSNTNGLFLLSLKDKTVEQIIPDIFVRDIKHISDHELWVASESGLYIYNLKSKETKNIRKSLSNPYALADNALYSITTDKEGGIWISSYFKGVSYLPKFHLQFDKYLAERTHEQMCGNTVREISADNNGKVWYATEDNAVSKFDPATGVFTHYPIYSKSGQSITNIHGLTVVDDSVWIGTFNDGIHVLSAKTGREIAHYESGNTPGALNSDFVLSFLKTRTNKLIVATTSGASFFDPATKRFNAIDLGRPSASVYKMYEDSRGVLWFATAVGLVSYDDTTKAAKVYDYYSSGLGSSINYLINYVMEDSKNRLWVATHEGGLALFNRETGKATVYRENVGIPSAQLYSMLEDGQGNLWIASSKGLIRFNPEKEESYLYTRANGLPEDQFNYNSAYKDVNGRFYMGTIDGLISFMPGDLSKDTFVPTLYITDLSIDERADASRKHLLKGDASITELSEVVLPTSCSSFNLSFSALSFTSPASIHYEYMLEGVDKDWVHINKNRSVYYSNLSPGSYTFMVRSCNSSGLWNGENKTLSIIIPPPFYASTSAYFLYTFAVLLLLYFAFKYHKKRTGEKSLLRQEKLNREKERELYNSKVEFFTMVAHEIKTPLSLIKAPIESITGMQELNSDAKQSLKTVNRNVDRLINLSTQLLDFRKTEVEGFKLNFVRADVVQQLSSIIARFQPSFAENNKELIVTNDLDTFMAALDVEAFTKIMSNLLSNALKYSDKHVEIYYGIEKEGSGMFVVRVANDGVRIPDQEKDKVFEPFYRMKANMNVSGSGIGLSLARSLAELHNGYLSLDTSTSLTTFELRLPLIQQMVFEVHTQCCVAKEEQVEETVQIQNNQIIPSTKEAVLVVEDQEEMNAFIASELKYEYEVFRASNGAEALEILAKEMIKVVISDVMMPVMDGIELCKRIKGEPNTSHIPVILLTAKGTLDAKLEGLEVGADSYIDKPFSINYLKARISNLIKNREQILKAFGNSPLAVSTSLVANKVDEAFINKLNEFIYQNIDNPDLSVEILAEKLSMSTSSLYRKVKGISDMSPNDYIRVTRLKKAALMLCENNYRINEIAFLVGFSSASYFSSCFQKQFGMTPKEFKSQNT